MLDRVSNMSSFACGAVAAAFFATAAGLYLTQPTEAATAPVEVAETAVDLAAFTPSADAPSVTVMAQINSAYKFPITDGNEGQAYLIPLFSAADNVDTTRVVAAVMVNDLIAFDAMLAENVIGNARMGDLYAVAGAINTNSTFDASVSAALAMASLTPAENFSIIALDLPVAAAGLGVPLMPMVWSALAATLGLLAAWFMIGLRNRKSDAVADRFTKLQGVVIPAE